jgi:hypothetical protein
MSDGDLAERSVLPPLPRHLSNRLESPFFGRQKIHRLCTTNLLVRRFAGSFFLNFYPLIGEKGYRTSIFYVFGQNTHEQAKGADDPRKARYLQNVQTDR